MAVHIVTDSAADLTDAEAEELGVTVVPLSIRFADEEFVDRRDLSPHQFYAKLDSAAQLPETAAPSPGAFEVAFREALQRGADAIVCINLSSLLSATMASAQNGARACDEGDVRIVDSRSITWGLGSQVATAAQAAARGADADEVVALVEDMKPRTRVYGALDTLDNLKKGGRIGGAQAMLGALLSIKPIIDISTGEVQQEGQAPHPHQGAQAPGGQGRSRRSGGEPRRHARRRTRSRTVPRPVERPPRARRHPRR